jgi:hypothetical protein
VPEDVKVGERAAIFAFGAWLTGRKQVSGPFGAEYTAGEMAELAGRFCDSQGWTELPDGWSDKLKPYPKEG